MSTEKEKESIGGSLDDFLKEEGIYDNVNNAAIERIINSTVHPGSLVREDCIAELGLTITAAAEQLGVTRQALSNLINEKTSLTPGMSIRLEKLGWGRADAWIRMQANYDLAQIRLVEDDITAYPDTQS